MRGAYWMAMPDYENLNYFNHSTPHLRGFGRQDQDGMH